MITRYSLLVAMASAVAAGLLLASVSPARANLVTDPGFESCATVGVGATPPDWSGSARCAAIPHMGGWAAAFGANTLSQSIATTAGDTYDFSFWFEQAFIGGIPTDSFSASFGSDVVFNFTNPAINPIPYTFEDFTVTAAAASTTISFTSSGFSEWALDDVSVTAVPAPPLSPLGAALVGLFLLARRAYRRRTPVAST